MGLLLMLAAAGLPAVATPAPGPPELVEWIVERGRTLVLRVVLEEKGRLCAGELSVDPERQSLRFEGAGGALACERSVEASFADLEGLRVERRKAGFLMELGGDDEVKLTLLPLPHLRWLVEQHRRQRSARAELSDAYQRFHSGTVAGTGRGARSGLTPDLSPARLGLMRDATASHRPGELPPDVAADVAKAVELIQEAMGRPPAPAELVREAMYGRPVDASVTELIAEPGRFRNQLVRVRARLLRDEPESRKLRLEAEGVAVELRPEPGAEATFAEAASGWVGEEVEVVGRIRRRGAASAAGEGEAAGEHYLAGLECEGPEWTAAVQAPALDLKELFERPNDFDGASVRVVGCFRGRNARGDLPVTSQRSPHHWVIKSDRYAIWVTGQRPEGEGWALDLTYPPRSQWLEVTGRLRWKEGLGYLEADQVRPVAPPPGARVLPARRIRLATSTPDAPAEVVFSLPLEREALDSRARIVLQFDRSMDEESFAGRVRLRYADEPVPEARIATRLAYDDSRRALVVSPIRPLVAGRRVELLLLDGIVDFEQGPLGSRPGTPSSIEAVDVLAYDVSGTTHE